ncbi:LamB/YcsF family protein [Rhodobacteraceae bacterium THAF1]|uniref:LamB/YcsF family protein n=1 Tax=Palleronia sp. THAF1 TaxID=2587842 RepID=UPI000F41A322|nr:5-oxoprolinase subunit PxpA [Palleronia sp. THAF1]QFU07827.1 LamB/YcsF family protein [Palleronia sp. THAF1]VDC25644.1 LamB/YcsF family protein [Rhodobacteraceae bacterium THAF1]
MTKIDLNADMGEGFGPWRMTDDAALLDIVTSANIACGFHAGDWDTMADVMARAVAAGTNIGAHPGFPDLQGFGRRKMDMAPASVARLVQYQLGAAQAMARAAGGHVRHLKLHGALSNMAMVDGDLARVAYAAALDVQPDLVLMVLAATPMEDAAKALGATYAAEIFADRGYAEDGTLIPRGQSGAMVTDADEAAERISAMVREGAIITAKGTRIEARIDTVCLHGDEPSAVAAARTLRDRLVADGITIAPF